MVLNEHKHDIHPLFVLTPQRQHVNKAVVDTALILWSSLQRGLGKDEKDQNEN